MSKSSSTKQSRARAARRSPPARSRALRSSTHWSLCFGSRTGASIDELASATGWQKHSVRGALAGTLKKKGHAISSDVIDGVRRYRIAETQA